MLSTQAGTAGQPTLGGGPPTETNHAAKAQLTQQWKWWRPGGGPGCSCPSRQGRRRFVRHALRAVPQTTCSLARVRDQGAIPATSAHPAHYQAPSRGSETPLNWAATSGSACRPKPRGSVALSFERELGKSRAAMLSALARAGGLALARSAGPGAAGWLAPAVVSESITATAPQRSEPWHFQQRRRRRQSWLPPTQPLRHAPHPPPPLRPAAGGSGLCHTDRAQPDVFGPRRAGEGGCCTCFNR